MLKKLWAGLVKFVKRVTGRFRRVLSREAPVELPAPPKALSGEVQDASESSLEHDFIAHPVPQPDPIEAEFEEKSESESELSSTQSSKDSVSEDSILRTDLLKQFITLFIISTKPT